MTPRRPVLRWHGGKWRLAPWIISCLPPHRIYVEAFGGAASVLMRKPRTYAEVYNDLDSEVVTLFRCLRDKETSAQLKEEIILTPFAREEFALSYEPCRDPIEQSRRLIIRSFMGFGSNAHANICRSGFRANSNLSGTTPAHDWANWPDQIDAFVERLRGVIIENRNAIEIIKQHDSLETLFYMDPPYVHSTRVGLGQNRKNHAYRHEMTDADHIELADQLHSVDGMVVLSGYACDLYDHELYKGWHRQERKAYADGARERTEVLWLNDAAAHRFESPKLFEQVGV
jgi:DNA adenine methylase